MNNSDALPFIGHLAYVACHQIAAALLEGANLPDGVDAGEHVALGLRAVRPSGRDFDWEHRWPWPGQWSDRTDGGDIVHTGWRAMGAAAALPSTCLGRVVGDPRWANASRSLAGGGAPPLAGSTDPPFAARQGLPSPEGAIRPGRS